MNLGIILIDGAANHTFNRTKRKCNWHVYYIKKVQDIVFKVVARASEAQIAIKAMIYIFKVLLHLDLINFIPDLITFYNSGASMETELCLMVMLSEVHCDASSARPGLHVFYSDDMSG